MYLKSSQQLLCVCHTFWLSDYSKRNFWHHIKGEKIKNYLKTDDIQSSFKIYIKMIPVWLGLRISIRGYNDAVGRMLTCATILVTWSFFYEMAYYLPAWCDTGGQQSKKASRDKWNRSRTLFQFWAEALGTIAEPPAVLLFFCPKSSQPQAIVAPLAYVPECRRAWSHSWPSVTWNTSEKYA